MLVQQITLQFRNLKQQPFSWLLILVVTWAVLGSGPTWLISARLTHVWVLSWWFRIQHNILDSLTDMSGGQQALGRPGRQG